jgi:hypothetical protein
VRTMMMLANTVATVQSKNNSLSGGSSRSAHGWIPPGTKAGNQMGMTIDFTTFFELFAHSGQVTNTRRQRYICSVQEAAVFACSKYLL